MGVNKRYIVRNKWELEILKKHNIEGLNLNSPYLNTGYPYQFFTDGSNCPYVMDDCYFKTGCRNKCLYFEEVFVSNFLRKNKLKRILG